MLNGKTYSPSSYVGSPRFTRMEKTVRTTVQLILVEGYQTPVVNQVVHRQPLLEDVAEVLLWVLRPKQGGIDDL